MKSLTSKERLVRAARNQEVDRIPTLGGWMNGVRNLAALAGITTDQYLTDPLSGVIRANKALNMDAMVSPAVPKTLEEVRTGHLTEAKYEGTEPEELLAYAENLPDTEEGVLASIKFDPAAEEARLRDYFNSAFSHWQGMQPIPNFWDIGGPFPLYYRFGYIAFLEACVLYPDAVGRIWWANSRPARHRALILRKLYEEFDLVPVMFCGEDLCNNQGPMVSPEMLRKHYFPLVKANIEPLVDAGVRLVHHCDGDVRPIVPDILHMGFSGFQGFQYEVGMDPAELRKLRSLRGEAPIFFMGMSVSRTLPFGTPEDVREEVDYFLDVTDGGRGMFLFTANVTGVEVPVENIRAGYAHGQAWDAAKQRKAQRKTWPWLVSHPETR